MTLASRHPVVGRWHAVTCGEEPDAFLAACSCGWSCRVERAHPHGRYRQLAAVEAHWQAEVAALERPHWARIGAVA